jgi:hypothetical protein
MLLIGEISPVSVVKAFEDERKLKSSNNYFWATALFGLRGVYSNPVNGQTSYSSAAMGLQTNSSRASLVDMEPIEIHDQPAREPGALVRLTARPVSETLPTNNAPARARC